MNTHFSRFAPVLATLSAVIPFSVWAQTKVDLGKQATNIDFSQAAFTRPIKAGASLPAACSAGDMFLMSPGSSAGTLYTCAGGNSWIRLNSSSGSGTGSGIPFAADLGAANSYAVSLTGVNSYTDGLQILMLPAHSNTGASTIAVSGLSPIAIDTLAGLNSITPGAIRSGTPAYLVYSASDGYFTLENPATLTPQALAAGTGLLVDFTQNPPLASPDPNYICLQTQTCSPTGGQNLAGAAYLVLPNAASDPSTCTPGQIYFNTSLGSNRSCTATNIWSASGGGGAGSGTFCNVTGVASGAAACPGSPAPAALAGLIMSVQADAANTGAVTVNVAGLGAQPLLTSTGTALGANALRPGVTYLAAYAGSAFYLEPSVGPAALQAQWNFCTAAPCSTSTDINTQPYPITVPNWSPVYGLISAGTAPTGSNLVITIYRNGTSVQTFTLNAGSTSATLAPTFSCVQGDVLTASVTQVGSTLAGQRVTIVLTASLVGTTGTPGTNGVNGATGATGPVSLVTNPRSSAYQTVSSDFASCKSIPVSSGTFTVTMVPATSQPSPGQCVLIINYGSGVITVAPSGQNVNGSSSSLTLAAGSASQPTGALIISDGANYEAQVFGSASLGTTAIRTFNLTIGAYNASQGTNFFNNGSTPTATLLYNGGSLPSGGAGLPFMGYVGSGSLTAYWQWTIDPNWDSTKPVSIILGVADPNGNGGNLKANVRIGCYVSGSPYTPGYGLTGTTGSFTIPAGDYLEQTVAPLSMSACSAGQNAIVAIQRDDTVGGDSQDYMALMRATIQYSVR